VNIFEHLQARICPVCGAPSDRATLFLAASINPEQLGRFSFASRKQPEFMSYRLLRCNACERFMLPQRHHPRPWPVPTRRLPMTATKKPGSQPTPIRPPCVR
jgi:hypothetical protein